MADGSRGGAGGGGGGGGKGDVRADGHAARGMYRPVGISSHLSICYGSTNQHLQASGETEVCVAPRGCGVAGPGCRGAEVRGAGSRRLGKEGWKESVASALGFPSSQPPWGWGLGVKARAGGVCTMLPTGPCACLYTFLLHNRAGRKVVADPPTYLPTVSRADLGPDPAIHGRPYRGNRFRCALGMGVAEATELAAGGGGVVGDSHVMGHTSSRSVISILPSGSCCSTAASPFPGSDDAIAAMSMNTTGFGILYRPHPNPPANPVCAKVTVTWSENSNHFNLSFETKKWGPRFGLQRWRRSRSSQRCRALFDRRGRGVSVKCAAIAAAPPGR